jgi:hypothetical protein
LPKHPERDFRLQYDLAVNTDRIVVEQASELVFSAAINRFGPIPEWHRRGGTGSLKEAWVHPSRSLLPGHRTPSKGWFPAFGPLC